MVANVLRDRRHRRLFLEIAAGPTPRTRSAVRSSFTSRPRCRAMASTCEGRMRRFPRLCLRYSAARRGPMTSSHQVTPEASFVQGRGPTRRHPRRPPPPWHPDAVGGASTPSRLRLIHSYTATKERPSPHSGWGSIEAAETRVPWMSTGGVGGLSRQMGDLSRTAYRESTGCWSYPGGSFEHTNN